MFVFNSQEANSTIDQITGAAKDANVPIVELAEQMPKQYTKPARLDERTGRPVRRRREVCGSSRQSATAIRGISSQISEALSRGEQNTSLSGIGSLYIRVLRGCPEAPFALG